MTQRTTRPWLKWVLLASLAATSTGYLRSHSVAKREFSLTKIVTAVRQDETGVAIDDIAATDSPSGDCVLGDEGVTFADVDASGDGVVDALELEAYIDTEFSTYVECLSADPAVTEDDLAAAELVYENVVICVTDAFLSFSETNELTEETLPTFESTLAQACASPANKVSAKSSLTKETLDDVDESGLVVIIEEDLGNAGVPSDTVEEEESDFSFEDVDTDGSGDWSLDEITAYLDAVFEEFATYVSQDPSLTEDEIATILSDLETEKETLVGCVTDAYDEVTGAGTLITPEALAEFGSAVDSICGTSRKVLKRYGKSALKKLVKCHDSVSTTEEGNLLATVDGDLDDTDVPAEAVASAEDNFDFSLIDADGSGDWSFEEISAYLDATFGEFLTYLASDPSITEEDLAAIEQELYAEMEALYGCVSEAYDTFTTNGDLITPENVEEFLSTVDSYCVESRKSLKKYGKKALKKLVKCGEHETTETTEGGLLTPVEGELNAAGVPQDVVDSEEDEFDFSVIDTDGSGDWNLDEITAYLDAAFDEMLAYLSDDSSLTEDELAAIQDGLAVQKETLLNCVTQAYNEFTTGGTLITEEEVEAFGSLVDEICASSRKVLKRYGKTALKKLVKCGGYGNHSNVNNRPVAPVSKKAMKCGCSVHRPTTNGVSSKQMKCGCSQHLTNPVNRPNGSV